jgi:OHCU decarboxylase
MTAAALAGLDRAAFVAQFGAIFEDSPWIADRAFDKAPFASLDAAEAAMMEVLDRATPDEHLRLVRAHPDLAGRAALAGTLTADSALEQSVSGLAHLTDDERAQFTRLNAAYQAKFAFPFVMAVRRSDRQAILAAFKRRLENDPQTELQTALTEIKKIAHWRLAAMTTDDLQAKP